MPEVAAAAIGMAALCEVVAPAILEWSLRDSEALLFGAATVGAATLFAVAVLIRYRSWSGGAARLVRRRVFWAARWRPQPGRGWEIGPVRTPGDVLRCPFVWVCAGAFNYVAYLWGVQLTSAAAAVAVSTAAWAPVLAAAAALTGRLDARIRGRATVDAPGAHRGGRRREAAGLTVVAGLGAVAFAQAGSPAELMSSSALPGMGVLLLSVALGAASITGSVMHARLMAYEQTGVTAERIEDRSESDWRMMMWLAMLTGTAARIVVHPVILAAGLWRSGWQWALDQRAAAGVVVLGCLGGMQLAAYRVGNIGSRTAAVNLLLAAAPVAATGLLLVQGVDVPRLWLFLAGAAAVFAGNFAVTAAQKPPVAAGSP